MDEGTAAKRSGPCQVGEPQRGVPVGVQIGVQVGSQVGASSVVRSERRSMLPAEIRVSWGLTSPSRRMWSVRSRRPVARSATSRAVSRPQRRALRGCAPGWRPGALRSKR